jgi:flagella basal body P-ring formation protein FlgA
MLPLILAAITSLSDCHVIRQDHIFGRDLAAAVSGLTALSPASDFGLAPIPGHPRVFQAAELRRIAAANHINAEITDKVCFVWSMKVPSQELLLNAMKRSFGSRQVQLEFVDQSRWPAPEGEVSFPLSSLTLSTSGQAVWRGYVSYASNRRFEIWASIRISVRELHVIAAEKLESGRPLRASQLKLETYYGAITRDEPLTGLDEVVGLLPRFDISAGKTLTRDLLEIPKVVQRGDTLTVATESAHARVEAECIAEESGPSGAIIAVHNSRSGRKFRVQIQAKGKAIVAFSDALGLIAEGALR